ncbi:ABC transporter ATP-binding protein [Paenibacillus eucommiae]|uniref:Spermidine/putrescine import ATP-binding protein PotA n=1 Tax=Paenibacillus eucommiae TaxID=1355755 RepID=A0ABS4J825_9BACL|nr:ABC transporter ATP-binding protein [Paenibacillus eucommiae]MBP1995401.1 spermidine/putrescine ABC transporter ATP-binding subunit [Paenibacillus eucommiae]
MAIGASLEIDGVSKYYKKFAAVDKVSFSVEKGEFFTILGPSGSGKTSLLKLIAGFEEADQGCIHLNGIDITHIKAFRRDIGMLFQNYALFPHLSVFDNVAYPLKNRKFSKSEIKEKVKDVLKMVKLDGFEARFPKQLSGGQQQRVALARAIVYDPPLLLLDEPLSALDKNLRQQMQMEIKRIQKKVGITTICVTHDQEEALTMSDRVCVMNQGGIVQIDTPEQLYTFPKSKFVAEFIGETNLIRGTVASATRTQAAVQTEGDVALSVNLPADGDKANWKPGQEIWIAVRPEHIHVVTQPDQFDTILDGTVEETIYVGEAIKAKVKTSFGKELHMKVSTNYAAHLKSGMPIRVGWDSHHVSLIPDDHAEAAPTDKSVEPQVAV